MRIGALAAATGMTTNTIRFYEQIGVLPEPPRAPNGYRDYPSTSATRLGFIRDAQAAGLTLAEIRGVLTIRDSGQSPCRHVTGLIEQHLHGVERRITELTHTRAALRNLHRKAAATTPANCTDTEICTILSPLDATSQTTAQR